MKRPLIIIITAIGVVFGGAMSALAGGPSPPRVVKISLHQAYMRALPVVGHGPIGYGMRPKGAKTSHVVNRAGCTEPNCAVTWHGGIVQKTPKVWVLLWGPNWSSAGADTVYIGNFYSGLGVAPQDNWSTITSQYGDGTGFPAFGGSVLANSTLYQDTTTPPTGVTPNDLAAEAYGFAQSEGITDLVNTQVVIVSQSGTTFSDGFGTVYCGWHSYVIANSQPNVIMTNLPYQPDAGINCGSSYGTFAGFSIVGGHEYGETIPDGYLNAWYDAADPNDGGGEIADKCAWVDAKTGQPDIRTMTFANGSFPMQPLFSNTAFASTGDGCVYTSKPADKVTITDPGTRSSNLNASVSLQIHASSSLGEVLTYSASGLPTGLSINGATGLISGHVTYPGNFTAHVTAKDTDGITASAAFAWRVFAVHGAIKLRYHNRHCANAGSLASGRRCLFSCNGTLTQQWAGFPAGRSGDTAAPARSTRTGAWTSRERRRRTARRST